MLRTHLAEASLETLANDLSLGDAKELGTGFQTALLVRLNVDLFADHGAASPYIVTYIVRPGSPWMLLLPRQDWPPDHRDEAGPPDVEIAGEEVDAGGGQAPALQTRLREFSRLGPAGDVGLVRDDDQHQARLGSTLDSHFVCAAFSDGCETRRCQITA